MSKYDYGLGGAPNINIFVKKQSEKLEKCEQTFKSIFDFMFMLEDNVMAEYTDGNRIFSVTYGECKTKIGQISCAMKEKLKDVEKNSIVGIYMDNCIEWIQIFWAILKCGYVPLLMNKRLGRDLLENVLDENNVACVISDGSSFGVPTYDYKELTDAKTEKIYQVDDWADEIIFMSSGTSLTVKLCVYSGKRICKQIYNSVKILETSNEIQAHVEGKIKQLAFLPFYHIFGFLACYMWFAFFARTFVFLKDLNSDTILKTVRKHKVTHIFAVPMLWTKIESAALKTISERGEKTKKKFEKGMKIAGKLGGTPLGALFSKIAFREVREKIFGDSIRFMISGGGNIPERTLAFFNAIGYRLVNGYGMTEVGITSVQLEKKMKIINSGAVGKPFDSVDYKLLDGELLVKGSSMASFIISEGLKKELKDDEWFKTEDHAEEKDGYWYILGRKDDMVITSSGENVRPEFVENKINIQGTECVLLAMPKGDGAIYSLLLVSVSGKKDESEIKNEIAEMLKKEGLYTSVDKIELTHAPLLKGTEFKVNRKRIKAEILSSDITFINKELEEKKEILVDDMMMSVAKAFEKALSRELSKEDYDANFFVDLGGTSLCYFELCDEIKKGFGVDLLAETNEILHTVNEVCEYLKKQNN